VVKKDMEVNKISDTSKELLKNEFDAARRQNDEKKEKEYSSETE
jgi:hypothetical protein